MQVADFPGGVHSCGHGSRLTHSQRPNYLTREEVDGILDHSECCLWDNPQAGMIVPFLTHSFDEVMSRDLTSLTQQPYKTNLCLDVTELVSRAMTV